MKDVTPQTRILDINLLPREQRPAEVPPLGIALAAGMAIAVAAMVPLGFKAESARSHASTIEDQAKQAEYDVHGVQIELTQRRALTTDIETAKSQIAKLQKTQSLIQGGARPLSADLSEVWGWGFLPAGSRITTVTGTDTGFRVDGTAPGPLDAIAYADKLVSTGGFKSARMASFTPGTKGGGQFSVEVTR